MRILAFKADADFWCTRCAQEVYPGCLTADVDDREGNLVCPIFEGADNLLLERCCRCGEELDPLPADVAEYVVFLSRMEPEYRGHELMEKAYRLKSYVESLHIE